MKEKGRGQGKRIPFCLIYICAKMGLGLVSVKAAVFKVIG
jgi:hypothetical protein